MEPPHSWTHLSNQFQLPTIAKENLNVGNLSGPEVRENQIPIIELSTGSEPEMERASKEARIRTPMKSNEAAEEKRINDEGKSSEG